jgi:hypothetical protein
MPLVDAFDDQGSTRAIVDGESGLARKTGHFILVQKLTVEIALVANDRPMIARFLREEPSKSTMIATRLLEPPRSRGKRRTHLKRLFLAAEVVAQRCRYITAGRSTRGLWKLAIGEVASRRGVSTQTVQLALQSHRTKKGTENLG